MDDIFSTLKSFSFPNPKVILEIGSADCTDTPKIMEATDFTYGEYYAFEPDPINLVNVKELDLCRRLDFHLIPAAIGNENRRVQFHRSSGFNVNLGKEHTYSGSVKSPLNHLVVHPSIAFKETITVPMLRLDDFVNTYSIGEIQFIWCDVQGAEDLVLSGGQEALRRTRLFYTEYSNYNLYENQIGLMEISNKLPGKWEIAKLWDNDVLFSRNE